MEANTDNTSQLTVREIEILKLVTIGMTSDEIAGHLNRSKYTIDTHRKNMLKKLGMRNTYELIKHCLQRNLF